MIDAPEVGVVFRHIGRVADVVDGAFRGAGVGRQRKVLQQIAGDGIAHRIALPLSGHHRRGGRGRVLVIAFPTEEEEGVVPADGTTHRAAVLIVAQDVFLAVQFIGEEVRGLQFIVAEELEGAAVELIAAALGNHVDLRARLTPEFHRWRSGDDAEFLHRVGDAIALRGARHLGIQRVHAVDLPVGGLRTRSGGRESPCLGSRSAERYPWSENRDVVETPVCGGQISDQVGIERGAGRNPFRIENRRDARDFNRLGDLADGEFQVHGNDLIDQNRDVFRLGAAETAGFHDQPIGAGSDLQELVEARIVRCGFERCVR